MSWGRKATGPNQGQPGYRTESRSPCAPQRRSSPDSHSRAYADAPANTEVNTITLSFTDTADGPTVAVTPAGNANGGTFACTAVAAESSTCSYTAGTDTLAGYTGLTGITITVA